MTMSHLHAPMLPPVGTPAPPVGPQRVVATTPTYAGAEQIVDRLADRGFPVEHCRIVGNGLRSVEYVTGRLTRRQATLTGASSGAWFGLLFGLLLGLFTHDSAWFAVVAGSTLIGAVWMGIFGFIAHWAARGRRDFTSMQTFEADNYAVYVDAARADEAIRTAGLF